MTDEDRLVQIDGLLATGGLEMSSRVELLRQRVALVAQIEQE